MKRYKRLGILLGVLVVISGLTLGVMHYQERKEEIRTSDQIILSIDPDTVQTVSWHYEANDLSFHRDGGWKYDGDEAFPVDEEKLKALLTPLSSLGAAFVIEGVEDYAQYGLEQPLCTIQLTTQEESIELAVGDFSAMDAKRYVSLGDGSVYLVSHDLLEEYDAKLEELMKHDDIPQMEQVTALSFDGAETYTIVYQETGVPSYSAEDVYMVQGENLPLDPTRVEGYLNTLRFLSLTNCVTYQVTEQELSTYGLDAPTLTVAVEYTQEDGAEGQFTLCVGRSQEQLQQVQQGQESTEVSGYVRVGESALVYEISGADYEALLAASYDDLRHDQVIWADFDQITQVDVQLDGERYTLTTTPGEEAAVWNYQGEVVDITPFQTALTELTASSFTQQEGTDHVEISLTVHLNHETIPQVELVFYRWDGTYCLAEVDGKPVCLVERTGVVELMEAVHGMVLDSPVS